MRRLDAEAVNSFSEDTKEAEVSAQLYDGIYAAFLEDGFWNFNSLDVELAREVDPPTYGGYLYQYAKPSDWLRTIDVVDVYDSPVDYRDIGGKILANDTRVKLVYQASIEESRLPPSVVEALVSRCMYEFAEPISGEGNVIERAAREAEAKLKIAKRIDAQSNPPQRIVTPANSTWLRARKGY